MLRRRAVWQDVNPSGSRIKHAAAVAHRRRAGQIEARGEQLVAIRVGYHLHNVAGQIHDTNVRLVVPEIGQEERVVRRVRADEEQAEVSSRQERQTARRRQSSLAGSRSRTSHSRSGGSTPAPGSAGRSG